MICVQLCVGATVASFGYGHPKEEGEWSQLISQLAFQADFVIFHIAWDILQPTKSDDDAWMSTRMKSLTTPNWIHSVGIQAESFRSFALQSVSIISPVSYHFNAELINTFHNFYRFLRKFFADERTQSRRCLSIHNSNCRSSTMAASDSNIGSYQLSILQFRKWMNIFLVSESWINASITKLLKWIRNQKSGSLRRSRRCCCWWNAAKLLYSTKVKFNER